MKLSASTHLSILITFAVIFVGFYLYYTINDVRKMTIDLKKISNEVNALSSSLNTLTKEFSDIQKCNLDVQKVYNMNDMLVTELNSAFKCDKKQCVLNDDIESVDTADIKKMLNDQEETNDEEIPQEENVDENDDEADE